MLENNNWAGASTRLLFMIYLNVQYVFLLIQIEIDKEKMCFETSLWLVLLSRHFVVYKLNINKEVWYFIVNAPPTSQNLKNKIIRFLTVNFIYFLRYIHLKCVENYETTFSYLHVNLIIFFYLKYEGVGLICVIFHIFGWQTDIFCVMQSVNPFI